MSEPLEAMPVVESRDRRMWSVTTLLGEGIPKPGLKVWAANMAAQYAVEKRAAWSALADEDPQEAMRLIAGAHRRGTGRAADRGTDVHAILEALGNGIEPKVAPEHAGYADQIRRFFEEHEPVVELTESTVYNLTYNYAGTLDSIMRFPRLADGLRVIVDMKTTDKLPENAAKSQTDPFATGTKGSRPPFAEVALQTVGYARAEVIGLSRGRMEERQWKRYYLFDPETDQHEPMPKIEGAFALVVSPADYRLVPLRIDDEVWSAFLNVREVARWQLSTSKNVLGLPVEVEQRKAA